MRTVFITSIADIPMKCSACNWTGSAAQCAAIERAKIVPGKVTGVCLACGVAAVQSADCEYSFKVLREEEANAK